LRKERWITNPTLIKETYGFKIYLNPSDTRGVCPSIGVTGYHELHITELFRKLMRKGMVIIDLGANIGWYSLLAAAVLGDHGIIIAYEPEPNNFALLSKSIEINNFRSIRAFQCCVSNIDGYRTLHLASENLGGHSIVRQMGESDIDVPSITLDTALRKMNIDHVDLLKMDVEGAEPDVIIGAREIIPKVSHIIMEWDPRVWQGRKDLFDRYLGIFDVYEIVRSPFLTKKIDRDGLSSTRRANLFLRRP